MNHITYKYLSAIEFYSLYKILPSLMKETAEYYPYFNRWLHSKVLFGTALRTRQVLVAYDKKQPIGLTIMKKSFVEHKLCTCWVDPCYQRYGIGTTLLAETLSKMNHDSFITIPEFRVNDFRTIISKMHFQQLKTIENLYQPGVDEYFFKIPMINSFYENPTNYSKDFQHLLVSNL